MYGECWRCLGYDTAYDFLRELAAKEAQRNREDGQGEWTLKMDLGPEDTYNYEREEIEEVSPTVESDPEHLDHITPRFMTARERYNVKFAEQKAKDALDNDDLSLETVEELLGMINIPASSRRKHVIPRGEKKVQGLLFGLYCHHGAAGITVATDECPHLVKLLAKIM